MRGTALYVIPTTTTTTRGNKFSVMNKAKVLSHTKEIETRERKKQVENANFSFKRDFSMKYDDFSVKNDLKC